LQDSYIVSLIGGALIGIAVSIMLLFNGRVTGISGILAASLEKPSREGAWRLMFLLGLLAGGALMFSAQPALFGQGRNYILTAIAGLLVGYGTVMGGGCTSGHGVCGISRLSIRSLAATITFMLFGFVTVAVIRLITGRG